MKDVYDRIKGNRKGGKIDGRGGNRQRKGKESKGKQRKMLHLETTE